MNHQPPDINTFTIKHLQDFGQEGFYKADLDVMKNFAKVFLELDDKIKEDENVIEMDKEEDIGAAMDKYNRFESSVVILSMIWFDVPSEENVGYM